MLSLARRDLVAEIMDDPDIDPMVHRRALCGLVRLNRLSAPDRALWRAIRRAQPATRRLRVLDVACGSADVSLALQRRAAAHGVALDLVGVDASVTAVQEARQRATAAGARATFERLDVLAEPLPTTDVAMCSLFLHHLDGERAARLLRAMAAAARHLVLVDDLARGAIGLALATAVPYLVTRSAVVHVDARRSIRAAFTPGEARALALGAGLTQVDVTRHWPRRFLLSAAAGIDRSDACEP